MSVSTLPHWDMTTVYPALDDLTFEQDVEQLIQSISDLSAFFDAHEIQFKDNISVDSSVISVFEQLIEKYNTVVEKQQTMGTFIMSFVTTDSRNTLAQSKMSMFQQHGIKMSMLSTRLTAWVGAMDIDALIAQSEVAQAHSFWLKKTKESATHLMSPQEEALAAELNLTGGSAWSKLHGAITSQMMVDVHTKDGIETMPMSAVRNLASNANRDLRRAGYEAELAAWEKTEVSTAASLNGVKGQVGLLARKRGWNSPLDTALFDSHIDRETLDAMMDAAKASFPDFRRYFKAKAKGLGLDKLAWYDISAPLGDGRTWTYSEAENFIIEQFGEYSDKLKDLAQRAFSENWIDAEPRNGKRDGAFCMKIRNDESRILANFKPSYGSVSTLAHELGHAYHNVKLATQRTSFQRINPMTLAETASIFCEALVQDAALKNADTAEQLSILEASLQRDSQLVTDICSRFHFEKTVFEKRSERELSVDEFKSIMLEGQKLTFGDDVDESTYHPYMWAVKPHYYRTELSFYNYPYMFGRLFGLGLFARYKADPENFKSGYDDLLASTGIADAAELARRFDIDIRSPAFWTASLDVIRADINQFEALVNG